MERIARNQYLPTSRRKEDREYGPDQVKTFNPQACLERAKMHGDKWQCGRLWIWGMRRASWGHPLMPRFRSGLLPLETTSRRVRSCFFSPSVVGWVLPLRKMLQRLLLQVLETVPEPARQPHAAPQNTDQVPTKSPAPLEYGSKFKRTTQQTSSRKETNDRRSTKRK